MGIQNHTSVDPDVLQLMERRGGGFASALAVAWMRADHINSMKLLAAFQDLYNSYFQMLVKERPPC